MFKRKDGLWQEQITITVGGKKKNKYFYGRTQAEIKKKLMEYHGEVENGRLFSVVADEWWEKHSETLAYNSIKNYKPAYERSKDEFGDRHIKTIKANEIDLYISDFARQYSAQKTVKTQLMILNLICKYAVVKGDIEYNPVSSVSIPKNLRKEKRDMPSDDDIEKIKSSVQCNFGLFAYFLLYTGCRKGEALAIQFKDIDRKNKVLRITKSIFHDNNRPKIKAPKTEAGERDVILLDRLLDKLPKGKPDDYLFHNAKSGILSETQFQRQWELYQKDSEVECTPHQLRHAYATILFEAGISAKDAQELLGHANVATTQDIYTHIRKLRKKKIGDILNAI